MPLYVYRAKSLKGEEKSGALEAKDLQQLARTLKNQGFILIEAAASEEKKKLGIPQFSLGGVSLTEKMMFTRNLQVMVASGLALPRALGTLANQTKSKQFQKALLEIREDIMRGQNFSQSLTKYPTIFSELFQSMIKVAEESGTLEQALKVLTQQMEREHELRAKIKGALMYPAVVVSAMIGIGILMLIMVVPKLAETFQELNIELPLTTRVVIGLGTFLVQKWFLAIFIILGLGFLFWLALKNKKGKAFFDKLLLMVPIISPLIKKTNSAYTVRTLSSLISAGVPIVRSLEITAGTLGNIYFKKAINEAVEKVRRGEKLSESLKPYQNLYLPIVIEMIAVGEETGETADILAKLAVFFEDEVGNATKNITAVVEPVLMLVVGAVIGFFAISMVQPMYSMLEAI